MEYLNLLYVSNVAFFHFLSILTLSSLILLPVLIHTTGDIHNGESLSSATESGYLSYHFGVTMSVAGILHMWYLLTWTRLVVGHASNTERILKVALCVIAFVVFIFYVVIALVPLLIHQALHGVATIGIMFSHIAFFIILVSAWQTRVLRLLTSEAVIICGALVLCGIVIAAMASRQYWRYDTGLLMLYMELVAIFLILISDAALLSVRLLGDKSILVIAPTESSILVL